MPRAAFATLGCKVNQYETETIEGLFKQQGYDIVTFDDVADVYVINTCSVTHLGERKSRQLIRRATRINPNATIVVTGCYAQVSPDQVESIPGVDVVVGTSDRGRIVEYVEESLKGSGKINAVKNIMEAEAFEDIPLFAVPGRTRAFLKIQEGCTNYCTYCIIPYARGPLRSRTLESIVSEAEKLVAGGFKEIVLTGIHLGAYGRDFEGKPVALADAVRAVLGVRGLARLRLSSLESVEVSDEIIEFMQKDKRLCPHLHLPLQSGSDAVLLRMNRHYTTEEYRRLVEGIQERVSGIAITTDVIVGFPGETREMFEDSLKFIDSIDFAKMHIFPYSRRAGTPAAEYTDQVREEEKRYRARVLQQLADRKSALYHARFLDQAAQVLFESEASGIVDGLTPNYIRVYAAGSQALIGTLKQVRLIRQHKDGLWAEIVD